MSQSALDRVLQALDTAGCRYRGGHDQYNAQCPAHEDRNPSLSIRHNGTDRVLLNCQTGCDTGQIVAALGLTMRDLFDHDPDNSDQPLKLQRHITATYDYTDAEGVVLFQKVRYFPKDFRVRRPTRDGNWEPSIGDAERVLYRLPDVLAAVAEGRPIFLTEGEKDADRVVDLGAVGTCNFDGAAKEGQRSKWRPAYGDTLRGARVTVIADNDPAGHAHARAVVADLRGKAASVRVVRGLVDSKGADLSDHLGAGHDLDDLIEIDLDAPANPQRSTWGLPQSIAKNAKTPLPPSLGRAPAKLWAMVDAVAASYQVPRDMPFLLILAILATSIGGRRRVRVAQDWTEVLALYTVTVLPSGEKKSPVLAAVAEPLMAIEKSMQQEAAPVVARDRALYELRAAAVEKIKKSGRTDPDTIANLEGAVKELEETVVPVVPRLLADDATPEALAQLMGKHGGRLGALSAEAGLFAILAGRYSKGIPNLDLVLKAWSGDQCRVDRISRDPLILDEPVLSIGLAVQPDMLAGLAEAKQFRGAGLLARFLFSLPTSLVGTRMSDAVIPVPEQVARVYGWAVQKLARTVRAAEQTSEIKLSDRSREILDEFRDRQEPRLHPEQGDLAHIADWANKLPGQLVRIAALFTLFEDPGAAEIAENDMRQALELAPYFVGHALDAFELMSGRGSPWEPARAVLAWIHRKQLAAFTVRQAWRELSGQTWVTETDDVREALADLEDLGWVRARAQPQEPRRGRPTEPYDVNPAVIGNFGTAIARRAAS